MNLQINRSVIEEQAARVALKFGLGNFKASNGCFVRFKKCHRLTYKDMCSRSHSVDENMVDCWKIQLLPMHSEGYSPKDIFNAKKTDIFSTFFARKQFQLEKFDTGKRRLRRGQQLFKFRWE